MRAAFSAAHGVSANETSAPPTFYATLSLLGDEPLTINNTAPEREPLVVAILGTPSGVLSLVRQLTRNISTRGAESSLCKAVGDAVADGDRQLGAATLRQDMLFEHATRVETERDTLRWVSPKSGSAALALNPKGGTSPGSTRAGLPRRQRHRLRSSH